MPQFPVLMMHTFEGKGYAAGGGSTSVVTIKGIAFGSETTFVSSGTVRRLKSSTAGVNSPTKGYALGGYYGTTATDIDVLNFAIDLSYDSSSALPVGQRRATGTNSITSGYIMGGGVTTIQAVRFSTDAGASIAATVVARSFLSGFNSSSCGYAAGGDSLTEIDGIRFDTEAAVNPAATLGTTATTATGVNSAWRGYTLGGTNYSPPYAIAVIQGMRFDTEAAITASATLSVARSQSAGVNSGTRGYALGGTTGSDVDEIDGLRFDTESSINPQSALSVGCSDACGYQWGFV